MPQITPGQVVPGQNGAPALYGINSVENAIPFQERLMRLFAPHEWVEIKNVADEPIYWQYLPSHAEEITHEPGTQMKTVQRGTPEMWVIEPGQTEKLVGASAYMALDVMYKNITANSVLKRAGITNSFDKENNHVPKNFNFSDGGTQETFIKQAYLGKVELFQTSAAPSPIEPMQPATPQKELSSAGGAKK